MALFGTSPIVGAMLDKLEGRRFALVGELEGEQGTRLWDHERLLKGLLPLFGAAYAPQPSPGVTDIVLGPRRSARPFGKLGARIHDGAGFRALLVLTPDDLVQLLRLGAASAAGLEAWCELELPMPSLAGASLRGANLSNAKLWGVDARGADLEGSDLSGVTMWRRRSPLTKCDFSGANLSGCDLRGASMDRAILRGADCRGAKLQSVRMSAVEADGVDLTSADLEGADLNGDFRGARLGNARLARARLSGDFSNAEASGSDLSEVVADGAWAAAQLAGATLGPTFNPSSLVNADLRRADARGADLDGSDLTGARVDGADFDGASVLLARYDAEQSRACRGLPLPGASRAQGSGPRLDALAAFDFGTMDVSSSAACESMGKKVVLHARLDYRRPTARLEILYEDRPKKAVSVAFEGSTLASAIVACASRAGHLPLIRREVRSEIRDHRHVRQSPGFALLEAAWLEAFGIGPEGGPARDAARQAARERATVAASSYGSLDVSLLDKLRDCDDDDPLWLVAADQLAQSGDFRGQMIALTLEARRLERLGQPAHELERRVRELQELHRDEILGAHSRSRRLSFEIVGAFPRHMSVADGSARDIADLLGHPLTYFVRDLTLWSDDERVVTALGPLMATLRLARFEVRARKFAAASLVRGQTRLESVDLTDTSVVDAAPLAELEGLTSLLISNTGITDLSPLTALPKLARLDISHLSVSAARPLLRIPTLELIHAREGKFSGAGAIEELRDRLGRP